MIIESKRVWTSGMFMPAQIELTDGKITGIYPLGSKDADVSYGNNRIIPGMIDIHTHGAYGFDTNDAEPEGLRNWTKRIPEDGCTALLATTVTQLPDVLEKAVANVAKVIREGYEGAEILGIHFEGPYLDMEYKGAQPPEAIAKATVDQFKSYQDKAEGWIKYITLAPEHDEDFALTRYCAENGVVVSMGHSSAGIECAKMAAANGASSTTHVYNGMSPFKHREPGLVGSAFRIPDLYSEVIGDGHHSTPDALNIFFKTKMPGRAIMISDSLRAKHCPPGGHYTLGGHEIEIAESGLAYLKGTNTIAGSTLRMNKGLQVLIEEAQVPTADAINACTLNPAACLSVDDRKGRIRVGYDADICVLDNDYEVIQTYCMGKAML